jgi:MinD-like ATPase involved in chromosome partitioning or flagellar assembly
LNKNQFPYIGERDDGSSNEVKKNGEGGMGKTNVAGNLAIACQRLGKKVLIFDADLGLANIDTIFGLNPKHNIAEVIRREKSYPIIAQEEIGCHHLPLQN